ncbi:MAG: S26 family signal peptidase [Actinomycetota bacterium]|nr:S26 family signal peptidase [Actinomycetota bacterium]
MSAMEALIPWQLVRVEGQSMTPTLLAGDWLLVLHRGRVRPGAVVLARFRSQPELAVIKRAIAREDGGWLLSSDNPRAGSDSRQYGVADVRAVVVWQWQTGAGRRQPPLIARWLGGRPASQPPGGF